MIDLINRLIAHGVEMSIRNSHSLDAIIVTFSKDGYKYNYIIDVSDKYGFTPDIEEFIHRRLTSFLTHYRDYKGL